jgi:nucleoside phosphorylase
MADRPSILITFAVKEELAPFNGHLASLPGVNAVVTGMGENNARRGLLAALERHQPACVITGGFAGGLDPRLKFGQVLVDADAGFPLTVALESAGARTGTFHCAPRIAVTVTAKQELRRTSQADAVEMESGVIRGLCRERGIPSATVRVISDPADEDLPLDFNALYTADFRLHGGKLALALLARPWLIPRLFRFGQRVKFAAGELAGVLKKAIK